MAFLCVLALLAPAAVSRSEELLDPVSDGRTTAAALNPATGRLYLAHPGTRSVAVRDSRTGDLLARIPLSASASVSAMVVDAGADRVFLATTRVEGDSSPAEIIVLDGARQTVSARGTLEVDKPVALAINLTTQRLYVLDRNNGALVVDAGTLSTTGTIAGIPFQQAQAIAVDPSRNQVYLNYGDNAIRVIDGATDLLVTTIPLPASASALAFHPAVGRIFAMTANAVYVISANENRVIKTLPAAAGWTFDLMALDTVNGWLFRHATDSETGGRRVEMLDASTYALKSGANLTPAILGQWLLPDTARRVVLLCGWSLFEMDPATGRLSDKMVPAPYASSMAVCPATKRLYMVHSGTNGMVSVVDLKTQRLLARVTLPFGGTPCYVAVNPTTGRAYASNNGGRVCWIDPVTNEIGGAIQHVRPGSDPPSSTVTLAGVHPITGDVYLKDGCTLYRAGPSIEDMAPVLKACSDLFARTLAIDPVSGLIYIAEDEVVTRSAQIIVLEPSNHTEVGRINLPAVSGVDDIMVHPELGLAYVLDEGKGAIHVLDLASGALRRSFGTSGRNMAINARSDRLYTGGSSSDPSASTLNAYDAATGLALPIGNWPDLSYVYTMAVDADTGRLYVSNWTNGMVAVLQGPLDDRLTMGDVARSLRAAAGMLWPWPSDMQRFNVEGGATPARLELADTVRLARKVAGLDQNP